MDVLKGLYAQLLLDHHRRNHLVPFKNVDGRAPEPVRAPDIALIAKPCIPESGIPKTYWPQAPELAVKVTSATDRFTALQTKIAKLFSATPSLLWVVEPTTLTIYVYRSPDDVQALDETMN